MNFMVLPVFCIIFVHLSIVVLLQAGSFEGGAGRRLLAATLRAERCLHQPLRGQATASHRLGGQNARHALPGVHVPVIPAGPQVAPAPAQGGSIH